MLPRLSASTRACRQSARPNALALLLAASALSCAAKLDASYGVLVRVESDPGKPLPGARVSWQTKPLGTTGPQGIVRLKIPGKPGDRIALETTCPEGHRPPPEPLTVVLRALAERDKSPEYHVRCSPLKRSLVLSVRAQEGPNLPVRYLGKEIARTDDAGAAHALLQVAPGETVTVTLDTSTPENRVLMPQNPELKVTMPERDEIAVFDQTFTRPKPPKVKKRKPKPKGPTRL